MASCSPSSASRAASGRVNARAAVTLALELKSSADPQPDTTAPTVSIEARAYDAAGNVGYSAKINVAVANEAPATDITPPTVVIFSPADGATVSKNIKVSIAASDENSVARVEFYAGGVLVGSSTSANPTFNWNTNKLPRGHYQLQAVAYDPSGNQGYSTVATVYVR